MPALWPPFSRLIGGARRKPWVASQLMPKGGAGSDISTLFYAAGTADGSALADVSARSAIRIDGKMGAGQMVRVTFLASSAATFATDNCAIGVLTGGLASGGATVATPVELKFAGSSGFSISAGASITSDWLQFPGGFIMGNYFEVIIDFNAANGNPRIVGGLGATQAESCTKAATNSFNSAAALVGGSTTAGQVIGFNRIQVQ